MDNNNGGVEIGEGGGEGSGGREEWGGRQKTM